MGSSWAIEKRGIGDYKVLSAIIVMRGVLFRVPHTVLDRDRKASSDDMLNLVPGR